MLREIQARPLPGIPMAILLTLATGAGIYLFYLGARAESGPEAIAGIVCMTLAGIGMAGLFTVAPNEGKVLTLFGTYKGTAKTPGLWYTNPLMTRKEISLRIRNFETNKLKVNDARSNPVELGAIVVWKVIDTAEASFEVNDYVQYVAVQSVEVIEARISHLAYAPEIAAAMLQRQQASAIVAARQTIVEGAVGMVEMALDALSARQIVTLDDERKASMVSNLLVVLCSDRAAQPVVNTGTLYS